MPNSTPGEKQGVFTDDEMAKLIHSLLRGSGPLEEDRIVAFVKWCTEVRVNHEAIQGMIRGVFVANIRNRPTNEPLWGLAEEKP